MFILVVFSLSPFSVVYSQYSEDYSEYTSDILTGSSEEIEIALNHTRQLLNDNPLHKEERTNECAYLLELKQLDDAEDCLVKAVLDFPNDSVLIGNLAALHFVHGDYAAAKIQSAIAHNLDPDNIVAHSNLLSARVMAGDDPEEVLREANALIKKGNNIDNLFLTTAKLLNDKNRPIEARSFLEKITVSDNTDIKYFTQLGISYGLERDFENAEKYLLQGFQKDPNNVGVLKNLGKVYSDKGDESNDIEYYRKSLGFYNDVLKQDPENLSVKNGAEYVQDKINDIQMFQLYAAISLLLVAIISTVSITIFFNYRKTVEDERKEAVEKDPTKKDKLGKKIITSKIFMVVYSGFAVISLSVLIIPIIQPGWDFSESTDLSNWGTMIVEIAIGVMIAMTIKILDDSKNTKIARQQIEITKLANKTNTLITNTKDAVAEIKTIEKNQQNLIKEVRGFIQEENQRIKKRKTRFGNLIYEDLSSIKQRYDALEMWIKDYQKNPNPKLKADIIRNSKNNGDSITFFAQNITRFVSKIENDFDDPVLGVNLVNLCKNYSSLFFSMEQDYVWTTDGLTGTLRSINENQKLLDRDLQRIINEGAHSDEQ